MRLAAALLVVASLAGCAYDDANEMHEAFWTSEWEKKGDIADLSALMQKQGWVLNASRPDDPHQLLLDAAGGTLQADLAEGQILVANDVHDMFRIDVVAVGSHVACAKDAEPLLRPRLEPTIAALQAEYGPPLGSDFHSTDTGPQCHP